MPQPGPMGSSRLHLFIPWPGRGCAGTCTCLLAEADVDYEHVLEMDEGSIYIFQGRRITAHLAWERERRHQPGSQHGRGTPIYMAYLHSWRADDIAKNIIILPLRCERLCRRGQSTLYTKPGVIAKLKGTPERTRLTNAPHSIALNARKRRRGESARGKAEIRQKGYICGILKNAKSYVLCPWLWHGSPPGPTQGRANLRTHLRPTEPRSITPFTRWQAVCPGT